MIIVLASQFHKYLPWVNACLEQCPYSMCPLRDSENFADGSIAALLLADNVTGCVVMAHVAPVGKQSPKQREVAEPPPGAAGASVIS